MKPFAGTSGDLAQTRVGRLRFLIISPLKIVVNKAVKRAASIVAARLGVYLVLGTAFGWAVALD